MTFTAPCLPRNRANRQRVIARSVGLVPDASTMVDRILGIYDLATPEEHEAGAAWYGEANDIAQLVAKLGGWSVEAGAGIIAALSPQCSWDENIARALAYADGDRPGGLEDGLGKSDNIAHGAHPADVLGGRKVRSFYHNIAGHRHHVTVDRHAVAIVFGRSLSDREIKVLERIGSYTIIAAAYRAAARRLGVDPSTLQAITWLAWRRLKQVDDTAAF